MHSTRGLSVIPFLLVSVACPFRQPGGPSGASSDAGTSSSSGTSGASSGGTGSSGSSSNAGRDGYVRIWSALCQLSERCPETYGRIAVDSAACRDYGAWLADLYYTRAPDGSEFFDYDVDPVTLAQCEQAAVEVACDDTDSAEATCTSALHVHDAPGLGQPCGAADKDRQSCDSPFYCPLARPATCATCALEKATGAPCDSYLECESRDCTGGICVARPGLPRAHESCTGGCSGMLVCMDDGAGGTTCESARAEGEPCFMAGDCRWPLSCEAGSCTRRRPDGSPCTRTPLECEGACRFATSDAPTGTCGPVEPRPAALEPCAFGAPCAAGLFADRDRVAGVITCTCRPRLANGFPCGDDSTVCATRCVDGFCGGPPVVTPCRLDRDCAEGYCGVAPGDAERSCIGLQCVAAPSCTPVPTNTTQSAALVLAPGVATEVVLCDASATYWVALDGPFAVDTGLTVEIDARAVPGSDDITMDVLDDVGTVVTNRRVAFLSKTIAFTALGTGRFFLRFRSSATGAATGVAFVVLARVTPDDAAACSGMTNTSEASAALLSPGQASTLHFCSRGADTEYWWKLPGPFVAQEPLGLDVQASDATAGMRLALSLGGGAPEHYCYLPTRTDVQDTCRT